MRKKLKAVGYSGPGNMSLKRVFTTYTLHFGLILLLLGIPITIFGIFGVFLPLPQSMSGLEGVIDSIGNWKYWCVLIGPVLINAGGWYFFDNLAKRREFNELMETTSKAKFIRNLDRVEYLAWRLTPKHQSSFIEKKKGFKIK